MNVLDSFGRYPSLWCVSSGGSHLSISSAFSASFFVVMPIPAVGKECNLNALPKIELQMQGVERTICPAAKREGWPWPCNFWNKMEMGQVCKGALLRGWETGSVASSSQVFRKTKRTQIHPQAYQAYLYPNHPTPSKPQIINLFVWFAGSSPWPWIHQTTWQWTIAGLSLVPLRCRTQNPFGFWVSLCCGSTSPSMICRSGVSASQSLERARGSGEQCGGWDFCNSDADVRGLLFGLTLLPMFA